MYKHTHAEKLLIHTFNIKTSSTNAFPRSIIHFNLDYRKFKNVTMDNLDYLTGESENRKKMQVVIITFTKAVIDYTIYDLLILRRF